MAKTNHKLKVISPKNIFVKPLTFDFKQLFSSLTKGIGHFAIGKWEEIGNDTVGTLSAIGLATNPEELAFLLIKRAITKSVFDLVGESVGGQLSEVKGDSLRKLLDFSDFVLKVKIDNKFFDRPSELSVVTALQSLLRKWLELNGVGKLAAKSIVARLPGYFVFSLNQEWRQNAKTYGPLVEALNTPFSQAGDREWSWIAYSALLKKRTHEGIFDEPFSLRQMYVPLNAFFYEERSGENSIVEFTRDEMTRHLRHRKRVVVSLQSELESWLESAKSQDSIRVISGGPGSGKSSFARIFAAQVAENSGIKVLFVPLHLIDPLKDLVEEIGRFVKDEGILFQNPLDQDSPEPNLLIIFDGLDELTSQGKAAGETAMSFVREVERTVEKRNLQKIQLRVLFSGRELIIQENESEFRHPRQILNLLPYFVQPNNQSETRGPSESEDFEDPKEFLKADLRQQWWKQYGALIGKRFKELPNELGRPDLSEITAQPLLNFLVALSFTRKKLDFNKDINLNSIYADLVAAVHERGYEKRRASIKHMKPEEFSRVLEEIGLAAWHGDGRTTTVREIEEHCRTSGLGRLLDNFQEGAKAGVTRLLAAFFFRQFGQRPGGDPTFVFTHKSFGEYLAARRVVRAVERIFRELEFRKMNPDEGWDEREALRHWAQICGPSQVSRYLHKFIVNEFGLRSIEGLVQLQSCLANLFSYSLCHGMPMEQIHSMSFKAAMIQSRNAEEALLAVLNACAISTTTVSTIDLPNKNAFGAWFKRIQGQRTGPESVLAAQCLSFLDLNDSELDIADFYGADLVKSHLCGVQAYFTCFSSSDLDYANLSGAEMHYADFRYANLQGADLSDANLSESNCNNAKFGGAILTRAKLFEANLTRARLVGANLVGANLVGANLVEANLVGANLVGANLDGANFDGANLDGANLEGANLEGANFDGASLVGASLVGANLVGANLDGANLDGANLKGTILDGANLKGTILEGTT